MIRLTDEQEGIWVVYIDRENQKLGVRVGESGKFVRNSDDPNLAFVRFQKSGQIQTCRKKDLFLGSKIRKLIEDDLPLSQLIKED